MKIFYIRILLFAALMVVQLRPLLVIMATTPLVIITTVIITAVIITTVIIGVMVETRLSSQHSAHLLSVLFIVLYEQSILSDVSCLWFCSYHCVALVTRCVCSKQVTSENDF